MNLVTLRCTLSKFYVFYTMRVPYLWAILLSSHSYRFTKNYNTHFVRIRGRSLDSCWVNSCIHTSIHTHTTIASRDGRRARRGGCRLLIIIVLLPVITQLKFFCSWTDEMGLAAVAGAIASVVVVLALSVLLCYTVYIFIQHRRYSHIPSPKGAW